MSIPSCATESQICKKCYSTQSSPSTCTSSTSSNSSNGQQPCSSYCNSGCNTSCNTAQTYCNLGYQTITSISSVGSFPIKEVCGASNQTCEYSQYDRIDTAWSATNWNSIISKLAAAEKVGTYGRGSYSAPTPDKASSNGVVTAEKYNQIVAKINQFNKSLNKVDKDNLITATRANALRNGFNSAKFSTSMCDICNSGSQHLGGICSCNCDCACSCNCGCACPCDCSCSCNCGCSCGCDCSNTPTQTT